MIFIFIGDPLIKYKNFDLVDKVLMHFPNKKLVIITNNNLKISKK